MDDIRHSDTRTLQARNAGGSSPPTRNDYSEAQSSVTRNPAPDASPPSVPSPSHTFTVGK